MTYGAALNNRSEMEQLQLTLYRCGDALAAYNASKDIIVEYASGQATISQIDLDGAKSSLAYNIISGTANKPAAVTSQWVAGYTGVQADYTSWLLSQVKMPLCSPERQCTSLLVGCCCCCYARRGLPRDLTPVGLCAHPRSCCTPRWMR